MTTATVTRTPITLRTLRETIAPGTRWLVTNHYIKREDHPCYGTNEREVLATTGSSFTLSNGTDRPHGQPWPKASQVYVDDAGAIHMENHPHAPGPFLTFVEVKPCAHRSTAFYETRLPQHVRCLDCHAVGVYNDANVVEWGG